jgi:hypothetical protein
MGKSFRQDTFSFLSVAKIEPIINSLQELVISKKVKLVIQAK